MNNIRVIPRLDIKGPNLVKGIHLEGLRVLGEPHQFAKYYYQAGADELLYMDGVASLYGRNSLNEIIKETAKDIFIPLTVGGGIRTLDDISNVLKSGADKASLNTSVINTPDFIKEASKKFGSSTITVTIEAIKQSDGTYLAFTDNGREYTGLDAIEWAGRVAELGAGEIILTSVDKEGTGSGYDVSLTKAISDAVGIPVVASGGAGKCEHCIDIIRDGHADAISVASMFHYYYISTNKIHFSNRDEGNIDYLKTGNTPSRITTTTIKEIKNTLIENGFMCRPIEKYIESSR